MRVKVLFKFVIDYEKQKRNENKNRKIAAKRN